MKILFHPDSLWKHSISASFTCYKQLVSAASSDEACDSSIVNRLLAALKACSRSKDLEGGRQVHAEVIRRNLLQNRFVANSLISMYSKCGSMVDAEKIFQGMPCRDAVSWTALITGYVGEGKGELAFETFDRMDCPDSRSFIVAFKACGQLASTELVDSAGKQKWLSRGIDLHSRAEKQGWIADIYVASTLVDMYAKCGSMVLARKVFDGMLRRNIVSWTALLQGYVENGESRLALEMFDGLEESCIPDTRTYIAALSACAALGAGKSNSDWLEKGKEIHSRALRDQCCDIYIRNTLVNMYSRCGSLLHARSVFDDTEQTDTVSWNSLLQGCVENRESRMALELFDSMEEVAVWANARTYVAALTACASLAASEVGPRLGKTSRGGSSMWLEKTKAIHSQATMNGCCDTIVESSLVDVFGRCGGMVHAQAIFDNMKKQDVVSWNALLQGYVENEDSRLALELFDSIEEHKASIVPNTRTYTAALAACAAAAKDERLWRAKERSQWLQRGKSIHSQAARHKCSSIFLDNTLIDMYAKCGSLRHARCVFEQMAHRDRISWTALITGYVDCGEYEAALELILHMDANGVGQSSAVFVAALMACKSLMAFETGKAFHEEIKSRGLEKDTAVANCLVEFYANCGSMDMAKQVFESIAQKTVTSWNTLMCGYSLQGDTEQVFEVFEAMEEQSVRPNEVTFVFILNSCSHSGLVERGKELFHAMQPEYRVEPNLIHYNCMVDLLGRANNLDEAVKLVRSMPFRANAVTWSALLAACRKWNQVELGRWAYNSLLKLDSATGSGPYASMANLYGAVSSIHVPTTFEDSYRLLEESQDIYKNTT